MKMQCWVNVYICNAKLCEQLSCYSACHNIVFFFFFGFCSDDLNFLTWTLCRTHLLNWARAVKCCFCWIFCCLWSLSNVVSLHSPRGRRLRGRRWHQPLQWPRSMRPRKSWTPCLRRGLRTLALVSNNWTTDEIWVHTFVWSVRQSNKCRWCNEYLLS